MKIFLSHSSADKQKVAQIADALKQRGLQVWLDRWELGPGDSLTAKIEQGLADASILVAILSQASLQSSWVRAEINAFLNRTMSERGIRIIPVLLEDVEIPPLLRDRIYVDLSRDYSGGIEQLAAALVGSADAGPGLPDVVMIDTFDAGVVRPNLLGGSTVLFHENGDPDSLRTMFVNRGNGRALGLLFDFVQRHPGRLPPSFVGYATRLQLANWTQFTSCGYWLCLDARTDGNAMGLQLEMKRLAQPPREDSREEIAKWQVDLGPNWNTCSLRLRDIGVSNAAWDNMWEICFVLYHERVRGDHGLVELDNLRLSRTPS